MRKIIKLYYRFRAYLIVFLFGRKHDILLNKRIRLLDGDLAFYKNNVLHKFIGPALICLSGTREWWKNGVRHRRFGPAIISSEGDKLWYRNGKLHRKKGPAVVWSDGREDWYRNGEYYNLLILNHDNGGRTKILKSFDGKIKILDSR